MIKAGIVGATGYTGAELIRILSGHTEAKVCAVTSRSEAGDLVSSHYPSLRSCSELRYVDPSDVDYSTLDVVFFATPHGTSMHHVPAVLEAGCRVIDISADFRLKDPMQWEAVYGEAHSCPELLAEAVYGLPEWNADAISGARLIACPGCYPTAVLLGFLPLLKNSVVDAGSLIADAKTGVSGAGRAAKTGSLFCETADSISAYAVAGHRHLPEIVQGLNRFSGLSASLTFVPHLAPMNRGILATLYAVLLDSGCDLQKLYEDAYAGSPCVDVLPAGSHPATRSVRGSNLCQIAIHRPHGGDTVVVLSAIDNLVKGASGQAVQAMNMMFELPEDAGLANIGAVP